MLNLYLTYIGKIKGPKNSSDALGHRPTHVGGHSSQAYIPELVFMFLYFKGSFAPIYHGKGNQNEVDATSAKADDVSSTS